MSPLTGRLRFDNYVMLTLICTVCTRSALRDMELRTQWRSNGTKATTAVAQTAKARTCGRRYMRRTTSVQRGTTVSRLPLNWERSVETYYQAAGAVPIQGAVSSTSSTTIIFPVGQFTRYSLCRI